MKTNRESLIDAVAADMGAILAKGSLAAHDFNRLADIAKMGSAVCNSLGQATESVHLTRLIEESEYKAPTLYAELKLRAFNGETVLSQKYNQVEALHTNIKVNMLGAESARLEDKVAVLKMELAEAQGEQEKIVTKAALSSGLNPSLALASGEKVKKPRAKKAKTKE